ncbi:LexA family protein [Acidovorax sp. BL-A-41-H1]|uniref:LexA family protein n=1 Tax=Acidovorax sp. BL-A-41-H1 TaxID=3421102 RepID=UPI003F7ABA92
MNDANPSQSNVTPAPIGGRSIPVISAIQAGMWCEIVDQFQPGDADEYLLTDLELSAHAFALTIRGDSMLPEFNPGDRVIIDPEVAPHPGDFVAAKNGEQEATFKKYRPRGMDASGNMVFELVPLNDDYPTLRSDVEHIRIVGTMVEHRKYRRPR